jgi:hypothetical protein
VNRPGFPGASKIPRPVHPTGLLCLWSCIAHGVTHVVDDVTSFVASNQIALVGLSLDASAFVLEAAGAVSDDATLSAAGAAVGFAGTVVSAMGCKKGESLACIGFGVGATATTAGIVETGLEFAEVSPDASALLKGAGYTLGGAKVTLDVVAIVVTSDETVKVAAKKVATTVVKKK